MSAVPAWLAATAGQTGNAGAINENLGRHNSTLIYGGAQQDAQTTGGAAYASTAGTWLAQAFTPTTAAVGSLLLQISAVGGSPVLPLLAPLAVAIYADADGIPAGDPLATVQVGCDYVYSAPFWVPVPLAAAGLTPGTAYQIVIAPVGDGSHYYAWQQSDQPAGASTSPDGVTWTPAAYGLMYQVLDQSATGPLTGIVEDGGARWTQLTYNSAGQLTGIAEFTAGQAGAYLYSSRALTYSGGLLIGVA